MTFAAPFLSAPVRAGLSFSLPMRQTSDLRVTRFERLLPPSELKARLPISAAAAETVASARETVRDILAGRDRRLLAIVGPCSVHDPKAALEYGARLAGLRARVADAIFVVMRVYFEKPRTVVGWKGLVNDPHLDGSHDMNEGLALARRLLGELGDAGLPCATELLDPITPQYLADLISWTAIGARTTESQTHREMASGLSMPVGFKNGTDGALSVALNAMKSAMHPHSFLGIDQDGRTAIVASTGNPEVHLVLRGGARGPNYDDASVSAALGELERQGLPGGVVIDCSHDNSGKDALRQPAVCAEVVRLAGANAGVLGFMLESHLNEGSQKIAPTSELRYGVSITDACIGWEATERCLLAAANALRATRFAGVESAMAAR